MDSHYASHVIFLKHELNYIQDIFFLPGADRIFVLVKTVRMLKGIFNGEVIAEKLFTEKVIHFEVKKTGVYAVWQKGRLFKRTPAHQFTLKLFREPLISLNIAIAFNHMLYSNVLLFIWMITASNSLVVISNAPLLSGS